MKKASFALTVTGVILFSCSKNVSTPSLVFTEDCSGTAKSYATDVAPIIASHCATNSGCHASGSREGPGALLTYTQVYSARSEIRSQVISGAMPQNITLSSTQKNAVICWIDNGAGNN
ncbi:MAG TPA: hypothetical protein PLA68_01260 [Panacibacter sp.]|nr:hypothetical protein [Panacibacter sp.]